MEKIFLILFIGLIITVVEAPPLLKEKQKKELMVFSLIMLIGLFYNISFFLKGHAPNPFDVIEKIFKPMSEKIYQFLS